MLKSIRTRLTLAFVCLAIVPLLVVGVVLSVKSYEALQQQALLEQQSHAQRISTSVETFVRELERELVLLSKVYGFSHAGGEDQKWILDELLSYENRFEELILIGVDGTELIRRHRTRIITEDSLASRLNDPAFAVPASTGRSYFGPVHFDPANGEPLMTIAVPVQSPQTGMTEGVLVGKARLKKVWELLASLPVTSGETVFIVDSAGEVVGHPNPSVVLRGTHFTLPDNHLGITTGLGGEEVVLAAEHIELNEQFLNVVAQRPVADVLALARSIVGITLLLVLLALVAAVILSILAIGNIISPLRSLAAVAREIQQGDLSRRAELDRDDEVGELALAFNAMTDRLQVSMEGMAGEIEERLREIEVRKRAEEALRENRAMLQQILDTVPQSIFWKDRERVYQGCNRVFAEDAGLHNPELIKGKTDFDLPWPREEAEAYRADDLEVMGGKEAKRHIIEPLQQGDGARLWIDTTKVPLLDGQGNVYGILGVYEDITERRLNEEEREKLERQVRQSQKMEAIGTLAGGIAHDFNNILSIILGYNELAMLDDNPAKRLQNLEEVRKGAERARDLVSQILAFSRKADQERQPLQISLIIKEALKMLRASIPTTIEIRKNIASDSKVMADSTQIHQVIMNLCTNAYQVMRETGGTLAVSLTEIDIGEGEYGYADLHPGRYLRLEVSDTGCGIDPAIKDKIFEPYFTTKPQGEGTGMGLAVVHGIVKSHNGHISVYSEPGKGTSFHVYLPVTESEAASVPESPLPEVPVGHGERILFIDDEEQIIRIAQSMLTSNGYQVTACSSGVQALEEFRRQPDQFDLVITDMTMPHMTGIDLARNILAVNPDMPIILCTGQSELINRETALDMGCCAYLNKPILKQTLLQAVQKALACT
jgi:PAS domain S-box-containing protein